MGEFWHPMWSLLFFFGVSFFLFWLFKKWEEIEADKERSRISRLAEWNSRDELFKMFKRQIEWFSEKPTDGQRLVVMDQIRKAIELQDAIGRQNKPAPPPPAKSPEPPIADSPRINGMTLEEFANQPSPNRTMSVTVELPEFPPSVEFWNVEDMPVSYGKVPGLKPGLDCAAWDKSEPRPFDASSMRRNGFVISEAEFKRLVATARA